MRDFRILGPLEARLDGRLLNLGGSRQRGVLVLLLLHANEVVSADRLTDELWGDDPPQDAPAALQAHVSRLRKLLEPERDGQPRVIRTVPPGYLIEVRDDDLDLLRFQGLVAAARARLDGGDAAGAAATLREALAHVAGPPAGGSRERALRARPDPRAR